MQWEGFLMRRKPNRNDEFLNDADIIFQPAVTQIEAAALPALEVRGYGALKHARSMWRLDEAAPRSARTTSLGGWHLQRQNI